MDKCIPNFKYKERSRVGPFLEVLPHLEQVRIVNSLFLAPPCEDVQKQLLAELKHKRAGYKAQDLRRGIYIAERFISLEELLEHLVVSKLKCTYCKQNVEATYTQVRSPSQWSLDRIDNTIGHSADNTVVSCLHCNLRRRTIDYEKFKFTKNLRLVKKT